MVIIDRNITSLEGVFKAGQNVEGVLSESACNDLVKRGWAHKSQAKNAADQDDAQTDEQIAKAEAAAEAEGDDVIIDSLKELDQALEQPTETGGKSRKSNEL